MKKLSSNFIFDFIFQRITTLAKLLLASCGWLTLQLSLLLFICSSWLKMCVYYTTACTSLLQEFLIPTNLHHNKIILNKGSEKRIKYRRF